MKCRVTCILRGLFATNADPDRDRAFYPVVVIVIASYYVLFAVMSGSIHALVLDSLAGEVFLIVAGTGFADAPGG